MVWRNQASWRQDAGIWTDGAGDVLLPGPAAAWDGVDAADKGFAPVKNRKAAKRTWQTIVEGPNVDTMARIPARVSDYIKVTRMRGRNPQLIFCGVEQKMRSLLDVAGCVKAFVDEYFDECCKELKA